MQNVLANIYEDGVLLQLNVSYWRGAKSLRPSDLGLKAEDVPVIFNLGTKRLVPREAIAKFDSLYMKAYQRLNSMSFKFPVAGLWFVPTTIQDDVFAMLAEIENEWGQARDAFLVRLNELADQIVTQYPTLAESLAQVRPSLEYIKNSFVFRWSLLRVFFAKNDPQDQQYRDMINVFLEESLVLLRKSVLDAVTNVIETIEKGTANKNTLKRARAAVARFKSLNFMNDNTVAEKLDVFATLLVDNLEPEQALPTLREMRETVQTNSAVIVLEEYKRKINWT